MTTVEGPATPPIGARRARREPCWPVGHRGAGAVVRLVGATLLLWPLVLLAAVPKTGRVSVGAGGIEANAESGDSSVSADGRFVAFTSLADNLVAGDSNGVADVFLRDRETGETSRVSVASDGAQANGASQSPSLSADGRFVAFESDADNLVPGDRNRALDVFVHDRATHETTRVSVGAGATEGNDASEMPDLSADGRHVAFDSRASNLVPGDGNGEWDVFVHDRLAGTTARVSVGASGVEGKGASEMAEVSDSGRYVAFQSRASNLVPADTNGYWDIFVHDRVSGKTTRASVATGGAQANQNSYQASLSADGRVVAFFSSADNLAPGDGNQASDVFVHDRLGARTSRVSLGPGGAEANGNSGYPALSGNGGCVAFDSEASNLVPGDSNGLEDVFLFDLNTGETERLSVGVGESQPDGSSAAASLSVDGFVASFASAADNLVFADKNGLADVFARQQALRCAPRPTTILLPWAGNGRRPSSAANALYMPWAFGGRRR